MEFLGMSKADIQTWALSSPIYQPADKITVGAAIIREDNKGNKHILILKRAAHEAYYPGVFEIPGGKVNETDPSIYDAISREVAEETGLTILKVVSSLKPFSYTTEKQVGQGPSIKTIRKVALQLSYLVQVQQGEDFIVNLNEHSEGVWITADKLHTIPMTEEMRKLVLEAFDATEELVLIVGQCMPSEFKDDDRAHSKWTIAPSVAEFDELQHKHEGRSWYNIALRRFPKQNTGKFVFHQEFIVHPNTDAKT
ncbi:hypothetical protein FMEXI_13580 [Fusarium mexicanum]|uniref:Nudix hydrolase domain-containing protein n=1 Tax=Fusarium mexicanum TaxID=751941 RepID=A0A8H5I6B1_9HYPO|nr:hypothetical protein FMEXI_13580 [Fusarium mexicanum]